MNITYFSVGRKEDGVKHLKNDKDRIAFLEDYYNTENGWYLWLEIEVIGRRFWRYDLPDCSLVVEEDRRTVEWPERYVAWMVVNWYVVRDWDFKEKTFQDQVASRTRALMEIKRVQRDTRI